MKVLVGFCLLIIVCAIQAQQYTDKYDNIDLDQILRSDRLLKNYVNCLLSKGKCSPDGNELKKYLSDALEHDCAQCTPKQRAGAEKIFRFMIDNKRDWWNELEAKFDPTGNYRKKYEAEIKNRQ